MAKINRQEVLDKYNGHCAYCGCNLILKTMQVDHIWPKAKFHFFISRRYENREPCEFEQIGNLNPACISCNKRKASMPIEKFRQQLARDVFMLKRDVPKFSTALRYGQIKETESPIKFYYENYLIA